MGKSASDRRLSAAEQHRRASGAFEKAQTERFHSRFSAGRPLLAARKMVRQASNSESDAKPSRMSASSSAGMLLALCGSLFAVGYAAVLTALPHEA